MATMVLGVAGSAIGGAIGGSVFGVSAQLLGGVIGTAFGTGLDGLLFGGGRTVEGARLTDLAVQSSAYGAPVPLVYGTARVAGNVIWSTGLEETRNETSVGGKGGGGGATQVAYSYSASFAVALSGRPIEAVRRVWADGKMLRDSDGALAVPGEMRVYTGGESQLPDPLMEAVEGPDAVSAHRGLAYVVFEGLELAEYANRIPNLTFEVTADTGGDIALSDLLRDLAGRAGLRAVDVGDVTGRVDGFVMAGVGAARDALETLAAIHDFDMADVDRRLHFRSRPRFPVATVDARDLGIGGAALRMERHRRQGVEMPTEVCVRYVDPDRDYQVGAQRARRDSANSATRRLMDVPAVMTASTAKQAAERQLARVGQQREAYRLTMLPRYLGLAPGDVIQVSEAGRVYDLRLDRLMLDDGLRCEATAERASVYQSGATADGGQFPGQTIADSGETTLVLMNLPSVTPADQTVPVIHAAAAGAADGWRGAALYQSVDGELSYEQVAVLPVAATLGEATSQLGHGVSATWDEANSVNVTLLRDEMSLESRNELTVLNGANAALLGEEIVQFRNAVLESDGSYTLSGLLRGRQGTEWAMANHEVGEAFVLLSANGLRRVELRFGALDKAYHYKPVSANATLAETDTRTFVSSGLNLRPLAPVHAKGVRDGGGNLTLTWIRRTRIGGEWTDSADVPLGEEVERYEVDILSGGTVVRTLSTDTSEATYDAAQQISDFGSMQAAVSLRIHQISAAVGRGTPLAATL